jgi:hypothetical protein
MIRNRIRFYSKELLATRPTPKLYDHPLSAVRDCIVNIFTATLHTAGRSSIRNLKTRHALLTGTHSSHMGLTNWYNPKCFSPQGATFRKYWYILWAGSKMYVSRCKHPIKEHRVVCYVAKHTTRFSLIWYLHVDTYYVDPVHKIYQYSLQVAPWGLKRSGVYSANKQILTHITTLVWLLCKIDKSVHKRFPEYNIAGGM